jgi:hypothetical protein
MVFANILPIGIEVSYTEIIWSCEEETIKRNFQRDVLPLIEKGIRYVGLCEDGQGCANCYSYGDICSFHEETDFVDFENIRGGCTLTMVMQELNFFEFKKITGDEYVIIYNNWRERIEKFSNNQNY